MWWPRKPQPPTTRTEPRAFLGEELVVAMVRLRMWRVGGGAGGDEGFIAGVA